MILPVWEIHIFKSRTRTIYNVEWLVLILVLAVIRKMIRTSSGVTNNYITILPSRPFFL